MAKEHVRRNAAQIRKYLDVLVPILEPGGGIPETPMSRKERGGSRPPVSDHVMRLWMSNPDLGRINDAFRDIAHANKYITIEGRRMWEILADCLWDHTAIRTWKSKGADSVEMKRLWGMCLLVADILTEYDTPGEPYEINIRIEPEDEQLDTAWEGGVRDRAKTKSKNARTRLKNLYAETEEVMKEHGCTFKESWDIVNERRKERKREPVSPSTFERARRYMRGQLQEGDDGEIGYSRVVESEAEEAS